MVLLKTLKSRQSTGGADRGTLWGQEIVECTQLWYTYDETKSMAIWLLPVRQAYQRLRCGEVRSRKRLLDQQRGICQVRQLCELAFCHVQHSRGVGTASFRRYYWWKGCR